MSTRIESHPVQVTLPADQTPTDGNRPSPIFWLAGARYPNGAEIWCAYRGGEPAWTLDPRLAATYDSEASAAMAARRLLDGSASPFWKPANA